MRKLVKYEEQKITQFKIERNQYLQQVQDMVKESEEKRKVRSEAVQKVVMVLD